MSKNDRASGGADVRAPLIRDDRTSTSYPFWVIIDPKQVMRKDDSTSFAFAVTGVWLSRESAQAALDQRRYAYGKHAKVWTLSGHASHDWRRVCAGETPAEILEGEESPGVRE